MIVLNMHVHTHACTCAIHVNHDVLALHTTVHHLDVMFTFLVSHKLDEARQKKVTNFYLCKKLLKSLHESPVELKSIEVYRNQHI